ncbi:MAG: DUF192 domain-containing protein [bacterium]|nr:DUF192 domain-containing protein [bacterium]
MIQACAPMIYSATSMRERMRGLLGRTHLPTGEALYIKPCRAIHTLFMKFPIDVRFYNKRGELVKEILDVKPGCWFVWGGWRAHGVLESMAGDKTFQGLEHLPSIKTKEK